MNQKIRLLITVFKSKRIINHPKYNNDKQFCSFDYEDTGHSAIEFSYGRISYMNYEFYELCPIK
jgi:hypothetical protein